MKNTVILLILTIAISLQSCAQSKQESKVPEKVQTAFKAKFPDAEKAEWEMENDLEWEVEFRLNRTEYSASFSTEGEWMETEYEIKESEIPANVLAILDHNFSDYEIEEPEIAMTPTGKSYEMEIEMGEEEFEVAIDSKGNLTKKKEGEENDENDEG